MIDRLATTAAIAVRQAGAYTDLILSDLDVSSRLVRRRVSWAALALLSVNMAAVLGCTFLVAASWDSHYRLWVIAGLLLGFVLVAAASVWRLGVVDASAPGVLAQTAREWAKDRRVLEELLTQQRAQAR